jgi:site-specific recombinase XerD
MEYLNLMKEIGWAHNSFISKCMALKKFFEFCNLRGWRVLNENLIPIPQKEYKIPRVATPEEYKKLLNIIPKNTDPRNVRNEAIIRLLWDTGARNGEILALDMDDLDLVNNKALIKTEKEKTSCEKWKRLSALANQTSRYSLENQPRVMTPPNKQRHSMKLQV